MLVLCVLLHRRHALTHTNIWFVFIYYFFFPIAADTYTSFPGERLRVCLHFLFCLLFSCLAFFFTTRFLILSFGIVSNANVNKFLGKPFNFCIVETVV